MSTSSTSAEASSAPLPDASTADGSSPDEVAGTGRSRRPGLLGLGVLVLVSLLGWWVLHRNWFMAGDDYMHLDVGTPRGEFTLGQFFEGLTRDWTVTNGRMADAALRLVLRPGDWFYPLFAPVLLTATGLVIGWVALRQRRVARRQDPSAFPGALSDLWVWGAGLLAVPTVMRLYPEMAGDAVFWAPGAMNYVLPLGLTLLCVGIVAHMLDGGHVPWAVMPLLVVLVALTDALMEMSSLAMLVVLLTVVVTRWHDMTAKLWVLVATEVVAFAVHLSAPGLWARAELVEDDAPGGSLERLLHATAMSATVMWKGIPVLWVALALVLALLAARSGAARGERILGGLAVASVVAFQVASSAYLTRLPAGTSRATGIAEGMVSHTLLVVGSLGVVAVTVWLVLWRVVPEAGVVPLLVWAAFLGNCGYIFAGGVISARGFLPQTVLIFLLVLVLLAGRTVEFPRWDRTAAVLVVLGLLVPSIGWFDQTRVRMWRNATFVQTHMVEPLEAASETESGRVEIPMVPPYPELTYPYAFLLPTYEKHLRNYFEIPDGVELVNTVP